MSTGSRNRNAGHNYERQIVKEFTTLGFNNITTTRAESRNLDNKGVDIMGDIPFYIQCKYKVNNPNYHKLLTSTLLPIEKPTLIFHKKCHKSNEKFITDGEYVTLTKEYFYELIKLLKI